MIANYAAQILELARIIIAIALLKDLGQIAHLKFLI
jgi:hypothetical protein